MVLFGIALVFLFSALLALLQYVASEQALQQVVFWSLGSLSRASWPKLGVIVAVLLAVAPLFVVHAWKLPCTRSRSTRCRSAA
jgi:iron complex transport system permease protein